MVSAEFAPQKNEYTFAEILAITKDSLRAQINKEHLEKIFSYNVSNELMVVARAVPLFLKNLAMAPGLYPVGACQHDDGDQYRQYQGRKGI